MKIIILIIVVMLWWQRGYSHEVCEIKKTSIEVDEMCIDSLEAVTDWVEYVDEPFMDSCLRVLVSKYIKNEWHHIQQIDSAYTLGMGRHVMRMVILPKIADKNGVGLYSIDAGNDSSTIVIGGCALYDGEQILLPKTPEVRSPYLSDIPKDIYQVRLEVVEAFLNKHDNFTAEQKQEIIRLFTKGNLHTLPEPRYF
jgi:hypothetical protein